MADHDRGRFGDLDERGAEGARKALVPLVRDHASYVVRLHELLEVAHCGSTLVLCLIGGLVAHGHDTSEDGTCRYPDRGAAYREAAGGRSAAGVGAGRTGAQLSGERSTRRWPRRPASVDSPSGPRP